MEYMRAEIYLRNVQYFFSYNNIQRNVIVQTFKQRSRRIKLLIKNLIDITHRRYKPKTGQEVSRHIQVTERGNNK